MISYRNVQQALTRKIDQTKWNRFVLSPMYQNELKSLLLKPHKLIANVNFKIDKNETKFIFELGLT